MGKDTQPRSGLRSSIYYENILDGNLFLYLPTYTNSQRGGHMSRGWGAGGPEFYLLECFNYRAGLVAQLGRTGGAVCKVSYSLARATGRSCVQAPAAILAWLGNKYLLKSLMMSTHHSASVLDKPPWVQSRWAGCGAWFVLDSTTP